MFDDPSTLRRVCQALAVGTLLCSVALLVVMPAEAALAEGWRTPIMALELARTPDDVAFLSDPDLRSAFVWAHVWDVPFPLLYSGLLACVGRMQGARATGWAAAVACVSDLIENAVLVGMVQAWPDVGPWLWPLWVATWIKWLAIAGGLASIAWACRRRWPVTAGVLAVCAGSAPLAFVTHAPWAGEAMGIGVLVGFLGLMGSAWRAPAGSHVG